MSSDQDSLKALADVTHRFVAEGESLPAVTLPDGSKIQTGTVGALLQNIKMYDRIRAGEAIEGATEEELEKMMVSQFQRWQRLGSLTSFLQMTGLWALAPVEDSLA